MKLTRLELDIRLESPLLAGSDHSYGPYRDTRDYLPGAALRGALAQVLLDACGQREHLEDHQACPARKDCDFYTIFRAEPFPIFENCYPSVTGGMSYPLPLTARTCKYYAGFEEEDSGRARHGAGDIVVRQLVFEEMLDSSEVHPLPLLYEPRCPVCRRAIKPYRGFYGEGGPKYYRVNVPLSRTSRTAINRSRGVAEDGMLYSLQVMEPQTKQKPFSLRGSVVLDEDRMALLEGALEKVHRVGSGRSRGLGKIRIQTLGYDSVPWVSLDRRVTSFNDEVGKERAFYYKAKGLQPPRDASWLFTIDLLSDALLIAQGLPAARLPPEQLNLGHDKISLIRSFARHRTVGGWAAGAGLPRTTELATVMGSVFVYRVEGADLEELLPSLEELKRRGVGRERERGFGQVQICSPFHLEVM